MSVFIPSLIDVKLSIKDKTTTEGHNNIPKLTQYFKKMKNTYTAPGLISDEVYKIFSGLRTDQLAGNDSTSNSMN